MTAAVFFSAPVLCSPHHTFLRHQLHLTSLPAILYPTASADSWRGVGILTDRRSALSHPPPSEPHFRGAKPTRRAAELIVVLLLTRVTYSGVRGVFRGGRGRRCTSVALDYIINAGERK